MTEPGPLYRWIAGDLRRKIRDGTLPAGTRLTQDAVAAEYGTSVTTVRGAFAQLANEGLVDQKTGRHAGGTYVRDRITWTYHASRAGKVVGQHSESDLYITEVRAQGGDPSQRLEVSTLRLDAQIAERLGVPEGERGVLRRAIRSINGVPSSLADSYFPSVMVGRVPELAQPEDVKPGTTRLLAARGYSLIAYRDEITVRIPTPEEAELLDLGKGTPVLIETRTGYTVDGPVRVTVSTYAGDRIRLIHTIGDAAAIQEDP